MNKIYILSGPVKSGKSTRLKNWVESQQNIAGILCPLKDGKKYLYSISSKEYRQLESDKSTENTGVITIGKFSFLRESFNWADTEIMKAYRQKFDWIIFDEIGPLELKGEGLYPSLNFILNNKSEFGGCKLVLVVREKLVDEVISFLGRNGRNKCEIDFNLP